MPGDEGVRIVVYGIGAVGGAIASKLHLAGHNVIGVARGQQLEAVRKSGLRYKTPTEAIFIDLPVVGHPSQIDLADGDVVLLTVKSQHTVPALNELRSVAAPSTPIMCVQNAVANESSALRWFENVYGVLVMLPASFLVPGEIEVPGDINAKSASGVLDVGRWPHGVDPLAGRMSAAFRSAGFDSRPANDISRWKYGKLITNLGNVVTALCGPAAIHGPITALARAEARSCLDAAGIDYASQDETESRPSKELAFDLAETQHGSTWQSIARKSGSVETDYLNGEIAMLGKLHGAATPVNSGLQRIAFEAVRAGIPPGSVDSGTLLRQLQLND